MPSGATLRVDVVGVGFEISDELHRHVERRVSYALGRFGPWVERVTVRLSNTANPLGGVDQHCRMRAWLRRRRIVGVRTVDGSSAIDRAVARLARRVEWTLVDGRGAQGSFSHHFDEKPQPAKRRRRTPRREPR